ncbi:MAG: hypothetical protein ABIR26_03315, partial [Ramlibacter sp.]
MREVTTVKIPSDSAFAPRNARPISSPAVAGFRPAGAALAVAAAFSTFSAYGQPAGAQAIFGAASLTQQGSNLLVTTQNGAGTN